MYFETNKPRLNQDTLYDFVVDGLRGREVTSMRGPANTEEKQLINITKRPLCIVGKLLCCGEAGEKEKGSARGTMGRGKREERLPPFPSSHRPPLAFYFCRLLIF